MYTPYVILYNECTVYQNGGLIPLPSVWFGLVAYKMIYHNSGLTVLKCLNLVRCRCSNKRVRIYTV